MRSRYLLTGALLLGLVAAASADMLLWDNYPGGIDALAQNGAVNMSSERNTQVVESTWVIDDFIIDNGGGGSPTPDGIDTVLTRLDWVGARQLGTDYGTADVIFLDENFNTLLELTDLDYDIVQERDYLDPFARLYEGEITFGSPISMAMLGESHVYIGVRLVGSGFLEGRNHIVASSVDDTLYGQTEGYVQGAIFGAPPPAWRPASDVWYGVPDGSTPNINFEFAFQVYGEQIPEPASLGLLLAGGLLVLRRR